MSLLNWAWQITKWMEDRFNEADKLSCKDHEEESALLKKKQLGEGDQTSNSQCGMFSYGPIMTKPAQDLTKVEKKAKEWCEFASCNGLENVATSNTVTQLWKHIKISMPLSYDQPNTIVVKSHSTIPSCKYLWLTFSASAYDLSYMMHVSRRSAAKRLGATAGNRTHGRKTQIGQQKHGRRLLRGIGEGGGVDQALWRPGAALRAAAAAAGRAAAAAAAARAATAAAAAAAARRRRRRRRRTSTCNPKAEQPLVYTGADSVPFIEGSGSNIETAKMAICMKEPRLKKALNALRFKLLKELL